MKYLEENVFNKRGIYYPEKNVLSRKKCIIQKKMYYLEENVLSRRKCII